MNNNKLLELTKKGETENIEFKEKISGLNNEMVAFANSGGRKIFIGINDKNKNYCKNVNVPQYKLDVNDKYFRIEFYRSMDYLKLAGLNAPLNVPQNVPVNKG
ncbi:MAG: ATP-binding protein, partial [Candidatus Aenigmarchaeota archaeon]|nr:ATP-binding protein [Candidatus Aenigmarchaeota archaeon]